MTAFWRFTIDPHKQLKLLAQGLQNKAQRIAMSKAASPIKQLVVSNAPSDTGALKKSMRIKIKSYKNNTKWVCVIGPKSDYVKKGKKGKPSKKPSTYNQLVNKGTKNFTGRHHMDKASDAAGRIFIDRYIQSLREIVPTLMK